MQDVAIRENSCCTKKILRQENIVLLLSRKFLLILEVIPVGDKKLLLVNANTFVG